MDLDSREWKCYELNQLTKQLTSALETGSDYTIAQSAQAMVLFAQEIDPRRHQMLDEAENLRDAAEGIIDAMALINTEAIEEFVKLSREF